MRRTVHRSPLPAQSARGSQRWPRRASGETRLTSHSRHSPPQWRRRPLAVAAVPQLGKPRHTARRSPWRAQQSLPRLPKCGFEVRKVNGRITSQILAALLAQYACRRDLVPNLAAMEGATRRERAGRDGGLAKPRNRDVSSRTQHHLASPNRPPKRGSGSGRSQEHARPCAAHRNTSS